MLLELKHINNLIPAVGPPNFLTFTIIHFVMFSRKNWAEKIAQKEAGSIPKGIPIACLITHNCVAYGEKTIFCLIAIFKEFL